MTLKIDKLIYHLIDKKNGSIQKTNALANIAAIDTEILKFFEKLSTDLWKAEDSGNIVSGRFAQGKNPSKVKPYIDGILFSPNTLLKNSEYLADLLYEVSPSNSSRGVLAILLLKDPESVAQYVALYKIKSKDDRIVHILAGAQIPTLDVQEIKDSLVKDLQKGAIIPHPTKASYDLKVTEKQNAEPAQYFIDKFLGCIVKKSDEQQIKKIIPELINYSKVNGVQIYESKIPSLVQRLGSVTGNISTDTLISVIEDEGLFGSNYSQTSLRKYIINSTHIQQLDVDSKLFSLTNSGSRRKLIYKFSDPNYSGLEISGFPEIMQKIRKDNGDTVQISIETTKNNIEIRYE